MEVAILRRSACRYELRPFACCEIENIGLLAESLIVFLKNTHSNVLVILYNIKEVDSLPRSRRRRTSCRCVQLRYGRLD